MKSIFGVTWRLLQWCALAAVAYISMYIYGDGACTCCGAVRGGISDFFLVAAGTLHFPLQTRGLLCVCGASSLVLLLRVVASVALGGVLPPCASWASSLRPLSLCLSPYLALSVMVLWRPVPLALDLPPYCGDRGVWGLAGGLGGVS